MLFIVILFVIVCLVPEIYSTRKTLSRVLYINEGIEDTKDLKEVESTPAKKEDALEYLDNEVPESADNDAEELLRLINE